MAEKGKGKSKKKGRSAENAVFDIVRKIGLLGVGVASLTREKAEKITSDLVKKGNITQAEGRKLTQDMIKKSVATTKDIEAKVNTELKKAMNAAKFAKQDEIRRLEKKIELLEKKLHGKKTASKKK